MRTGLAVLLLILISCALHAAAQSEHVRALLDAHDWPNAQSLARELWDVARREQGENSAEAAAALDLLVESLWRGHEVQQDSHLELAETAVRMNERLHGEESLETALALYNLAIFHRLRHELEDAERVQTRALNIRLEWLGDSDPLVANSHAELGSIYYAQGDYDRAMTAYGQSLEIRREALGADALEVGVSLRLVGTVQTRLGQDHHALESFQQSLAIMQARLGPEHPGLGPTLSWLGAIQRRLGQYEAARETFAYALQIRRANLPPRHRDIGESLTLLASLDGQLGRYEVAVTGYEEGIAIIREHASEGDPYLAQLIRGYASLLQSGGELERALETMNEAIAMLDRPAAEAHPDLGIALEGRATIRRELGDYVGAKRDCERAIELHRAVFGPDSVDVSWSQQQLGITLYEMGDDVEAQRALTSALDGFRAHDVTDPTALGGTLNDLGLIAMRMGDYALAEEHIQTAIDVWRRSGHRDAILGLRNLGDVARARGDLDLARERYGLAIAEAEANPAAHALTLPGHYMSLASVQLDAGDLDAALASNGEALRRIEAMRALDSPRGAGVRAQRAVLLAALGSGDDAVDLAIAVEEQSRAHAELTIQSLPERQALRQVATRASGRDVLCEAAFRGELSDDRRRAAYESLIRSRSLVLDEFARRTQRLSGAEDPTVVALLLELQRARARLAHLLLNSPADPDDEMHRHSVLLAQREKESLESELASLGSDAEPAPPVGAPALAAALGHDARLLSYLRYGGDAARYGAFVLAAGVSSPWAIDLGPARPIDEAVALWHSTLTDTGAAANPGALERYREVAAALRSLVLDPLEPALGACETVYLVPDGSLHLLNFSTLPGDRGDYLLDGPRAFQLLSSERDLLQAELTWGEGILIVGGPDYDGDPSSDAMVVASLRGERSSCRSFTERVFRPLPMARSESETIAALWGRDAELHLGAHAQESVLKSDAGGKRALHLSTHGFVLSGACAGGQENPLLLAGLAFAGANRRNEATPGDEDGILTAEEAASLKLHGVEWVVLSACDTGTGRIEDGEGVLGLRRAFEIAGARSLITSLWPVSDDATARWMRSFYEARLLEGHSLDASVRSAARELRNDPRTAHPFYWGAFVASGRGD